MKLHYLLSLFLLASCIHEYEGQVCGEQSNASVTIHNFNEFWNVKGDINNDSFSCTGIYRIDAEQINPHYSTWSLYSRLRNVCNSDIPNIEFSVKLIKPQPELLIYGLYNDKYLKGGDYYLPLSSIDGINFFGKADFHFTDTGYESKDVFTSVNVRSITHGDVFVDSLYFFPNLESMSCKITAHKPK